MSFFNKKGKVEKVEKVEKEKKANDKKEKKVNKKELMDKQVNNNVVEKLKSFNVFKFLRIFIWSLIILLTVRGGATLFRGSEAELISKQNATFLEQLNKDSGIETRLFSFAESFTREYFTRFPANMDDFKNRILKYTNEQLANDMNNNSYSEIINASAFYFEKYSENQFNVGVEANIKQFILKENQENVDQSKKDYDIALITEYIEIPVVMNAKGELAVEDIPGSIAAPIKAEVKNNVFKGVSESSPEVTKKINDGLVEFFKAYYGGEQVQLDFFLESEGLMRPAAGNLTFGKIDSTEIYTLNTDEYLATVNLTTSSFGNDSTQRFNVVLIKNGDKFLIKSLETRTTNLNLDKVEEKQKKK